MGEGVKGWWWKNKLWLSCQTIEGVSFEGKAKGGLKSPIGGGSAGGTLVRELSWGDLGGRGRMKRGKRGGQ